MLVLIYYPDVAAGCTIDNTEQPRLVPKLSEGEPVCARVRAVKET